MRILNRHSMRDDDDVINELYQLLNMKEADEKVADWMAKNALRHSNQAVKQTLKRAGREDLVEYFIKEEDINVGDTIRSRYTGRFGKVTQVKKDGDTIVVRWETGGQQPLGKESVFKMRGDSVDSVEDLTKVHSVYDNYGDIEPKRDK